MILHADVLDGLAQLGAESVQVCVTSPPYYFQRVYEGLGEHAPWLGGSPLGNEPLADCLAWARQEPPCSTCYVCHMRTVSAAVWRVLRDDGTLWLNLGDKYAGSGGAGGDYGENGTREGQPKFGKVTTERLKPKNLYGIPWKVAFALQADGWILRSEIIWRKPSAMPQSSQSGQTSHRQWRTATSSDADTSPTDTIRYNSLAATVHRKDGTVRLNPKFVLWLMGWPSNWFDVPTNSASSETVSSRRQPRTRGENYGNK